MSKQGSKNQAQESWLRLPAEHGAVVTFAMASIVSLFLAPLDSHFGLKLMILWILFLSLHRRKQLVVITLLGAFIIYLLQDSLLNIIPISLMTAGPLLISSARSKLHASGRETLGMLGVSMMPFLLAATSGAPVSDTAIGGACYSACALAGTGMIRIARRDTHVSARFPMILSAVFWVPVVLTEPALSVVCMVPFVLEVEWLKKQAKPSFKRLGIVATLCMLVVTVSLSIWIKI